MANTLKAPCLERTEFKHRKCDTGSTQSLRQTLLNIKQSSEHAAQYPPRTRGKVENEASTVDNVAWRRFQKIGKLPELRYIY